MTYFDYFQALVSSWLAAHPLATVLCAMGMFGLYVFWGDYQIRKQERALDNSMRRLLKKANDRSTI